jgi:NADH:ubiquinone oxidoreductase subunit E
MEKKKQIKVCQGRVCRDNHEPLLEHITNNYKDTADVTTCQCRDNCDNGPNVVADGRIYEHSRIKDIIDRIEAQSGLPLPELDEESILNELLEF